MKGTNRWNLDKRIIKFDMTWFSFIIKLRNPINIPKALTRNQVDVVISFYQVIVYTYL